MLEQIRLVGVLVAAGIAVYGIVKYRAGGWRRLDLLLAMVIAVAVLAVSVTPQVGDVFLGLLDLQNRAFALLVASNLALLVLFVYLLNQVRTNNVKTGKLISSLAIREYFQRRRASERSEVDTSGRLLVIIPAYNEAATLREVVESLPDEVLGLRVEVLVVDDGSDDGTEEVSLAGGYPTAVLPVNRGQGDALRTGFEIARTEGADIVVNFDADGQYRADELPDLIKPILDGEADYVHGSRFMGYYEESGSVRHIGVVFFSRLISILTGQRITDATNGYRAIRGSLLHRLDLREDRFSATELILEALRKDMRLKEVPVSMLRRAEGESKKPKRLRYPFGVLRVIISTWLR